MKDRDYFGLSTDDDCDDFQVVDLNDDNDNNEDDFSVINLIHFDTEDDVRIVELADCERRRGREQWLDSEDNALSSSISALKSKATRKKRIIQSVVVVGLVCAFLLVFLGNSTVVRTAVASRFSTAMTNSAQIQASGPVALTIDSDRYYIAPNASGGPVSIDGRVLTHVPVIGVDPPLRFAYGQHILRWQTSRNQAMACTVSVPPSFSDTCAYDGPQPIQSGLAVWIISVPHAELEMP